jgi:hypothetical protein
LHDQIRLPELRHTMDGHGGFRAGTGMTNAMRTNAKHAPLQKHSLWRSSDFEQDLRNRRYEIPESAPATADAPHLMKTGGLRNAENRLRRSHDD